MSPILTQMSKVDYILELHLSSRVYIPLCTILQFKMLTDPYLDGQLFCDLPPPPPPHIYVSDRLLP